ncbi:dual specificity protein phosphatase family protein [Urechidicola vernalis]|uniref:protein-tyrosine-phosphatase n=1 Tax=Urechidicola vernalis TaxID=3075600 RepID=A0ABU2Y1Q2_9FLAO|nr:dual specificity protein phosphatase family protein [Urechidicola sp. P050]MDT0552097.1 dual specificity protein phosphatase family protein [Urechidicola sp. P050]
MSSKAILFTQCLQNDYCKPIGKYDHIPNLVHIGYEESVRLMGLTPKEGPVANTMRWAYEQSDEDLEIIHLRDWHDPEDKNQKEHLELYGDHCIQYTDGSRFAFHLDKYPRLATIIESLQLNDFVNTELEDILEPYKNEKIRVGIMGVMTEGKISFLAYDLKTRYPQFDIAVCSALCAGSSISSHYTALDNMQKILGIRVINSLGEFTSFLTGSSSNFEINAPEKDDLPKLSYNNDVNVSEADNSILKFLFRNARSVDFNVLDGGYSGNLVLGAKSVDNEGREEAPHVVKIGEQNEIGQERMSFERVESVLGNSAPRITDFIDYKGRGGIKYRYASMGKGSSTTFNKLFISGISLDQVKKYLDIVFIDQLGKFYNARTYEKSNLLEYYGHDPKRAERLKPRVEKVYGKPADDDILTLPTGQEFPNPYIFNRDVLETLLPLNNRSSYFAYTHGDLNGANIMVDPQENIWLIDFFHTHKGHVLRDLIKLENDLLYIYTPIYREEDLNEAVKLSEVLFEIRDLAQPLKPVEETGLTHPGFIRTYETLKILRSYYSALIGHDRDSLQLLIGQLRYSLHTLMFFESNNFHKLWALYNAGHTTRIITERIMSGGKLRVNWLDDDKMTSGEIGLTILPGRKDYSRSIDEDLKQLKEYKVDTIIPLITDDEFDHFGVGELLEKYQEYDFNVKRLPIMDQLVSSHQEMKELIDYLEERLQNNEKIVLHCVGGLGRSGLVAASYLKYKGRNAEDAIQSVRKVRGLRAVESKIQEEFVSEITFE